MIKIKGKIKEFADLTLWVMLIGGLVFTIGFGISLHIARQEALEETDNKVLLSISYIQNYIDCQLLRIEDVAYTALADERISYYKDKNRIVVEETENIYTSTMPIFKIMSQLLEYNPNICGVGLGFEPKIKTNYEGKFGSALYVTDIKGYTEYISLGKLNDYRSKGWYREVATLKQAHWCHTYHETSSGKPIISFGIPLCNPNDSLIGVFDIDINPETFLMKCAKDASFKGAEVMLIDDNNNFISHPDTSLFMRNISELSDTKLEKITPSDKSKNKVIKERSTLNKYTYKDATVYVAPISRIGWRVAVKCTNDIIFEDVNQMREHLLLIALLSIAFMILCFILIFKHLREITVNQTNIESELKIAADIQKSMLPKPYSDSESKNRLSIYGFLKPAKDIGGDLYDYFVRDGKCYFCIGDVCGKGVPASLFMSIIHAMFRHVSETSDDPAYIVNKINQVIASDNDNEMFCTFFMGILDLETGILKWCNAGHNAPVSKKSETDGTLFINYDYQDVNFPIGTFPDTEYTTQQTQWNPGDAIFLYTDGITEAENKKHKPFSDEALLDTSRNAFHDSAISCKDFADIVLAKVKQHTDGAEQSDDITMLILEFLGNKQTKKTLHLTNDVAQTPVLGEWITNIGKQNGLNESQIFKMNLAIEEAVVNCMKYAYEDKQNQPVDVFLTAENGTLSFLIDDEGFPFDPTKEVQEPDTSLPSEKRPIGGLGVMIAKQYAQAINYERRDRHNRLTMTFDKNVL